MSVSIMRVKVQLLSEKKSKKTLELKDGSTAYDLVRILKLSPDMCIVTRKDSPIPIDEKLCDGDEVKLISVRYTPL